MNESQDLLLWLILAIFLWHLHYDIQLIQEHLGIVNAEGVLTDTLHSQTKGEG